MRHLWIFVHLLGFSMWVGGGLAAMMIGLAARREPRENQAQAVRTLAVVYRTLILPGTLATVVSGLVLTLIIYGGPGAALVVNHWSMTMQATGILAALLTLIVLVPNVSRLLRIDPVAQAAHYDALRNKQSRIGMISGLLALIALVAGALSRP